MKKIFTTLFILTGFCATVSAQAKNQFEFGLNIGYNAATVQVSENLSNSDYRSGFNLGASGEYYFSDRWSIKGRVSYDQKGWNNGYIAIGSSEYITDYHLDYITVPVMANWHFGRTRNWYLHFGPYVGFLLNATETTQGTDLKSVVKSADVGFDAGIGIRFPVAANTKFFIEADGQGSFGDIFKQNSGTAVMNERSSINIGVVFSVK